MKIGHARDKYPEPKNRIANQCVSQQGSGLVLQEKKSGKNKERSELEKMLNLNASWWVLFSY